MATTRTRCGWHDPKPQQALMRQALAIATVGFCVGILLALLTY